MLVPESPRYSPSSNTEFVILSATEFVILSAAKDLLPDEVQILCCADDSLYRRGAPATSHVMMLQEVPPFLLRGIPVVAVPPNCPFQGCGYRCCFIAKLRLSLSRTGVHMMTSHPNAFEWDQRCGHATFSLVKKSAAKFVSPAKGKCQPKGNADGRGFTTTDLS